MHQRKSFALAFAALVSVAACGSEGGGATPDAGNNPDVDAPPAPTGVLKRPSKSSTVAVSNDDSLVAMVNPDDNSVSFFRTSDDTRIGEPFKCGAEPSSVAIAPDGKTAFVSNRADATVVKITGIDTGNPQIAGTANVGSEPTGVALSPTGARLFVAEFAEGRFTVIDTSTMAIIQSVKGTIRNPRAIAVTNNGDANDNDETVVLPEFFGDVNADNSDDFDTLDSSRIGRVRTYSAAPPFNGLDPILFNPRSSGITPTGAAAPVTTSPNQLYAVGIRRDASGGVKIYVPTVSASPQAPVVFNGNHYPVVLAADLATRTELTTPDGSVNLAERVLAFAGNRGGKTFTAGDMTNKLFLAEIVDMDFLPASGATSETGVAYVLSRAADAIQRVTFDPVNGAVLGSDANLQVDMIGGAAFSSGCKGANGIVVRHDGAKAYVNCWVSHNLGVVLLGSEQRLDKAVESFTSDAAKLSVDKGRRFYFTGRGRWSGNAVNNLATAPPTLNNLAWGSCGSCHPDGLTDNVTWIFGAGPRQTTSMDGSFSKGAVLKQRAFNWTAINDEIHDFERNTRDTSGGIGAVTVAKSGQQCAGNLAGEDRQTLAGQLADPVRPLQEPPPGGTAGNCVSDFNDMEAFVKTIRPPHGLKTLNALQVDAGRAIFADTSTATSAGNCVKCHGGPGWTVSRVFYTPSVANNKVPDGTLRTLALVLANVPALQNNHAFQIEPENDNGTARAPDQVACTIRNVGTFATADLEERIVAGNRVKSQGAQGFNVPALYGLQLGAPYLHSGLALTLDQLLDPAGSYAGHLQSGNNNFFPDANQREALRQFLLSIDAQTEEIPVPTGFDICPDGP